MTDSRNDTIQNVLRRVLCQQPERRPVKFGILGGTFNPVHNGHLELAKQAIRQFDLDWLFLMPNHIPGYKKPDTNITNEQRAAMVKLAVEDMPMMEYSGFELDREGVTYTADTLELLTAAYPGVAWYFIMGGDSILQFDSWKNPEKILKLASLIVTTRDAVEMNDVRMKISELKKQYGACRIEAMDMKPLPISSTDIRKKRKSGYPIDGMVPDKVLAYIEANQLYCSDKDADDSRAETESGRAETEGGRREREEIEQ